MSDNWQPRPMSDEAKVPWRTQLVYFRRHGWMTVFWGSPWEDYDEITLKSGIWCVDDHKHGPYAVRGYSDGSDTHWMPLPPPPEELTDER